jgi:hypothetical protein
MITPIASSQQKMPPFRALQCERLRLTARLPGKRHEASELAPRFQVAQCFRPAAYLQGKHSGDGQAPLQNALPILGVVDDFETRTVPLLKKQNAQGHPSFNAFASHGEVIEAHIRAVNPAIQVKRYQMPFLWCRGNRNVREALKQVIHDWRHRQRADALSLSLGWQVPMERIRQDLNIPDLTADNLPQYRARILKDFYRIRFSGFPRFLNVEWFFRPAKKYVLDCIRLLGILSKRLPVYVSAGNRGAESLNLLLLTPGVHGVGASNAMGAAATYSGKNAWVNRWAKASQKFMPVCDPTGQLQGFSLAQGNLFQRLFKGKKGSVALPADRVRMWADESGNPVASKTDRWEALAMQGTSFAVPQAAAQDLTARANADGFWHSLKKWGHARA